MDRAESGKADVLPLGGLCQCMSDDLTRVLSGVVYMASTSLGHAVAWVRAQAGR